MNKLTLSLCILATSTSLAQVAKPKAANPAKPSAQLQNTDVTELKKQIQEGVEQLFFFIMFLCFTVAFFRADSVTMNAIGFILLVCTIVCFFYLCNTITSVYIDVKFLNKSFKE